MKRWIFPVDVLGSSATNSTKCGRLKGANIEQQIKSFATGRRAWLFSYDAGGAQASANLYSLVMTARANDVEPYAYLNYLFEHLPATSTVEQIEALLPWNVKPMLEEQKKPPTSAQSAAA